MILMTLAVSILSNLIASPTNVAIAATLPVSKNDNKVAVDKFGIREIYPTTPNGGREWFINMSSPLQDNNFFLSGGTEITKPL
ncbi:MAG: hypothetical protein WA667_03705 [Candidatus Nitrosopolaris sp.]